MLININNKEYEFVYGWGALYLFENITEGQTFNPRNHAQLHLMYYCILSNRNKDKSLSQEEFIDALDTQPGLCKTLDEAFAQEMKRWGEIQGYTPTKNKKKAGSR